MRKTEKIPLCGDAIGHRSLRGPHLKLSTITLFVYLFFPQCKIDYQTCLFSQGSRPSLLDQRPSQAHVSPHMGTLIPLFNSGAIVHCPLRCPLYKL